MPRHEINCIDPHQCTLGEGPFWDALGSKLWWVDISEGQIFSKDFSETDDSGPAQSWDFGEPVGCVVPRAAGGLIVAAKSGYWTFDPATGHRAHLFDPESQLTNTRFNDGTTDPAGRFWAGTMASGQEDAGGTFYCLESDLSISSTMGPYFITNGLAFSPDGRRMYFSDSKPHIRTIWWCDYDLETGKVHSPQVFFDTNGVAGRPDGGTVDADGCYWMAGVGGWQLYRITPDGKIDMTIDVPVERPTKAVFGGKDMDTLFVTSAYDGITAGSQSKQPDAGGLFAITGLGVQGVAPARFAG